MPSKPAFRWVLASATLALATGCAEFGAGVCEHTYRDPVLAITAARDSASGRRITPLFITGISIGGQVLPLDPLMTAAFGARRTGDTLVCDVPCGFGTSEGRYAFTASAVGYELRVIALEARFTRFEGGCPSYNEGSTRTSVALRRSP